MAKWTNTYYATVEIPAFAYCHIGIHVEADSMGEAVEAVSQAMKDLLVAPMYVKRIITRIERLCEDEAEIASKIN